MQLPPPWESVVACCLRPTLARVRDLPHALGGAHHGRCIDARRVCVTLLELCATPGRVRGTLCLRDLLL